MKKTEKIKSVKSLNEEKEFAKIDALFKSLADDKSLPTFGQHFVHCMLFGIARNVDLKALYPKAYKKLDIWLANHNRRILVARRKV